MSFLVVLIVDQPDYCPAILQDWEELGVKGVTIIESTGLGRMRRNGMLDNLPLIPSLQTMFEASEERHRTLFSVVDDEILADKMAAVAQKVIGDLSAPNTGILFVVKVHKVYGLNRQDGL